MSSSDTSQMDRIHHEKMLRRIQKSLANEATVYERIALVSAQIENQLVLQKFAQVKKASLEALNRRTGSDIHANRCVVQALVLIARIFGSTFAVKLFERYDRKRLQAKKGMLQGQSAAIRKILTEDYEQEKELSSHIDEERLHYIGSMTAGLNDAVVQTTGVLTGLTFAMQNTKYIAASGLIAGIVSVLGMASSAYLSAKSEGKPDELNKPATYASTVYLVTVVLLILPFVFFPEEQYLWAFALMILVALIAIAAFNFYISVVKGFSFKQRFGQMAAIGLGMTIASFGLGLLVKWVFGLQ